MKETLSTLFEARMVRAVLSQPKKRIRSIRR